MHINSARSLKEKATMKLYIAVTYLNRREWGGDTVWAWARNSFELCLRYWLQDEGGGTIATHLSLLFEDVTPEIQQRARERLPDGFKNATSFFVDILSDGKHRLSVWDDPQSWHKQWTEVRVDLFRVPNVSDLNIDEAFNAVFMHVEEQTSYDCYQNCNMLWPFYPCKCTPTCGICCPCAAGVNCVSTTLEGLAAARGAEEWEAEEALGIPKRSSLGSWLPAHALRELQRAGVVGSLARRLLHVQGATRDAALPLVPLGVSLAR